jgi:hypothetical protein
MKLNYIPILLLISIITFSSCGTFSELFMKESKPFQEDFENEITFKKDWKNNSWKSPDSYSIENNKLKITTRAATKDRVKVRTKRRDFTTGLYTWRIFVPEFKLYEQISIGAFLYHNEEEEFEFDFEIGPGQKLDREKINLKNDEAIVFCVSQFSPSNSGHFAVKMNEYSDFKMELLNVDGFYLVKWYINNNLVKTLQTNVRSTIKFRVHNSLENLHFMGNKKTSSENYVLFDSFSYEINP